MAPAMLTATNAALVNSSKDHSAASGNQRTSHPSENDETCRDTTKTYPTDASGKVLPVGALEEGSRGSSGGQVGTGGGSGGLCAPGPPPTHACGLCGKSFYSASYLAQHQRIHSSHKPYGCQVCARRFTQLSHLQQHERTHTGERPYKCLHPGCSKAFSQLSNLQTHSRTHVPETMYKCSSCYKCFADAEGLLVHSRTHLGSRHLRMYACRLCGKSYTQDTYLQNHLKLKHSDVSGDGGVGLASSAAPGAIAASALAAATAVGEDRPAPKTSATKRKSAQSAAAAAATAGSDATVAKMHQAPTSSCQSVTTTQQQEKTVTTASDDLPRGRSRRSSSSNSYMACYPSVAEMKHDRNEALISSSDGAATCLQLWQQQQQLHQQLPTSNGGHAHDHMPFRNNPGGYATYASLPPDPIKPPATVWHGPELTSTQASYMLPMYQSFVPRTFDKYSF